MHPLVTNLSELKDSELYAKITELSKKYFMTRNPDLQWQISNVLNDLREEARIRSTRQMQESLKQNNQSLDKLIKFN